MKNLRIDFFTQPFEGTNFYININVDRAEFDWDEFKTHSFSLKNALIAY